MTIRKLSAMPYVQAQIRNYPETATVILQSYATDVIIISDGVMTVTGLYSATTRKHISAFMREIGLDYQTAKKAFEGNYKFDIYTGEVIFNE